MENDQQQTPEESEATRQEDLGRMIEGTFGSAVLLTIKGQFARREAWRNEFLVIAGSSKVPTEGVGDELLKAALTANDITEFASSANFRKIQPDTKTAVNGWLPSFEDIVARDWVAYNPDAIPTLKAIWELQDNLTFARFDTLMDMIGAVLTHMEVTYDTEMAEPEDSQFPAAVRAGLIILTHEKLPGVKIRVWDGGYKYVVPTENVDMIAAGTGDIVKELNQLAHQMNPQTEVKNDN